MNVTLVDALLVLIAILVGVIAGIVAGVLARSSGQTWAAAFCYGAGVFCGAVVLVLVVKDHLIAG